MKLDTFRSKLMSYGPTGYWRLNDPSYASASDATSFGNAGKYSSPAIMLKQYLADGIYGAGFPGVDTAYVTLPNAPSFRTPILSGVLSFKDEGSTANAQLIFFTGQSSVSPGWQLLRNGGTAQAYISVSTSAGALQSFALPGTPFDGNRHTVAWGFDGRFVYTSTDLSPWSTTTYLAGNGPVPESGTPFYIGRQAGTALPAKGIISDVAMFPYVLLNSQLSALAAAFASGNDSLEYTLLTANELLIADLITITLADDTVLRWTSFDFDVRFGAATFSSIGPRLRRGALKWKRGVESSPLELKVASASTDIATLGLTVAQAITAGYFNGAAVQLQRVYNPTRNADGTYAAAKALSLFQGWVGKIEQGRPYATITVNSLMERLHLQWPFTMLQPGCRWTLFDSGCGLTQANFAVGGSAQDGSSRSRILHTLSNATGYFDQGRISFNSGANSGLWRVVQSATASGASASYRQTVLNDSPAGYWRLGDGPGSGTAADISGNGNNGTVHGGVTFGQAGALVGDSATAALFDGVSGYVTLPISRPSSFAKGVSIEFWLKLPSDSAAAQPLGIFDTAPDSPFSLRNFGAGGGGGPAFEWGKKGQPSVGIAQPARETWVYLAIVYRGQNAVDVYYNGQFYSSATAQGRGQIDWKNPITIGNINGGANGWFKGYLQEFAVYPYALSADQPLAHFNAGTIAPSTNGNGVLVLTQPLPYAPAPGDTFTVYPGCDKSQRTCQIKFGNLANFGGFPYVPAPETAA